MRRLADYGLLLFVWWTNCSYQTLLNNTHQVRNVRTIMHSTLHFTFFNLTICCSLIALNVNLREEQGRVGQWRTVDWSIWIVISRNWKIRYSTRAHVDVDETSARANVNQTSNRYRNWNCFPVHLTNYRHERGVHAENSLPYWRRRKRCEAKTEKLTISSQREVQLQNGRGFSTITLMLPIYTIPLQNNRNHLQIPWRQLRASRGSNPFACEYFSVTLRESKQTVKRSAPNFWRPCAAFAMRRRAGTFIRNTEPCWRFNLQPAQ